MPHEQLNWLLHLKMKQQGKCPAELRSRTTSKTLAMLAWQGWRIFLDDPRIEAFQIQLFEEFQLVFSAEKNPHLLKEPKDPLNHFPKSSLN
ncbi:MAG: hypothetical protein H6581_08020 [Bacteroidia bacterium]|nr:hypothetical protein [Bacteroidia bacterium]